MSSISDFGKNSQFCKSFKYQKKLKKWLFQIKVEIFFIKNTYSIEKYYISNIKKVLTQKCKILKNDCLQCYSKTLCVGQGQWVSTLEAWGTTKE